MVEDLLRKKQKSSVELEMPVKLGRNKTTIATDVSPLQVSAKFVQLLIILVDLDNADMESVTYSD
jgi:hypothetical protein